ncbi:hypothetical protein ACHHRT_08870 [Desulfurivibrio sp. D14AmB]|uniref:hypothetical protein n=1 Tax=Desulfurivibrio sp. D14AmB TaxID=3374370 RepID=UPI00376EA45C
MREFFCLLALGFSFALVFPSLAPAGSVSTQTLHGLIDNIQGHEVTVLGEHHGRPESPRLLVELAEAMTRGGECLGVGLEIYSDQNESLAGFMAGDGPVGAIAVSSVIDHAGFREMLVELRRLVRDDRCLEIRAVDLPRRLWGGEMTRDEWMADQLAAMVGNGPVVALLGNAHAIKSVRWEDGVDRPYVAELLGRQAVEVFSVMQYWPAGVECEGRFGRWYDRCHGWAQAAFESVLRVRSVVEQDDVSGIGDGVVVWECG